MCGTEAEGQHALVDMPRLGLGTWQAPKGVVASAVKAAIRSGYRLIDCASSYGNEREIGKALHELINETKEIRRDELFIVSKVFNTHHVTIGETNRPRRSLLQTLEDLGLEQLDLWLMHWPISFAEECIPDGWLRDAKGTPNPKLTIQEEYIETWRCMEQLKAEGLVKHIGVSNFRKDQIENMINKGLSKPVVNQVELHPYLQQRDLVSFSKQLGIVLMAYSPLGSQASYSGRTYPKDTGFTLMENPTIISISKRYKRSPAQVLIKWSLQCGFVVIPKSANPDRIRDNFLPAVDESWELDSQEMEQIAGLDRNFRYSIGYLPGHYDCENAPW